MDWTGCELVEIVEGKSVVRGSAVEADALCEALLAREPWAAIAARFPELEPDAVRRVLTYAAERLGMDDKTEWDWSECELVERVPGRCSGSPTVVGTRIFPDTIAANYELGMSVDEIAEDYPRLSRETIEGLLAHAAKQSSFAA